MKESYQREEYCSDQRKGSLRHFQPPKNLESNSRPCLSFYFAKIGIIECNRDLTRIGQLSRSSRADRNARNVGRDLFQGNPARGGNLFSHVPVSCDRLQKSGLRISAHSAPLSQPSGRNGGSTRLAQLQLEAIRRMFRMWAFVRLHG